MNEEITFTIDELINFINIYDKDDNGNNFYTLGISSYKPNLYLLKANRKGIIKNAKILLNLEFINKIEIENINNNINNGYRLRGYIDINKYIEYINKNRNK